MPSVISAGDYTTFINQVLIRTRVEADEAAIVTSSLVDSDLTGHESHGGSRLRRYRAQLGTGEIVAGKKPRLVAGNPTQAHYECDFGFGQSAMQQVITEAIEQARLAKVYCAFVGKCNHIGRAAYFADQGARAGFVTIMLVNVNGVPRVAMFGGFQGRMGTNPIAISVPWHAGALSYDSSSCSIVEGKTSVARSNGTMLDPGHLIDPLGAPTCDPEVVYSNPAGAILPLGGLLNGFKGSGLSVMIDVVAGIISRSGYAKPNAPLGRNGVCMLLIDPTLMISLADLSTELDQYAAWIKSSARAPGVEEILLPGEKEQQLRAKRLKTGIPLTDGTCRDLTAVADELKLDLPLIAA